MPGRGPKPEASLPLPIAGSMKCCCRTYVWATLWHERSGVVLDHLKSLAAYIARINARPLAQKALKDQAEVVSVHKA